MASLHTTYVHLQTQLFSDERVPPDERERIDTRCALIAAVGGACSAAAGVAAMLVAAVVGAAIGTLFGPLATVGFSLMAASWGVWGGAAGGWWLTRRVQAGYLRRALDRSRRPLLVGGSGGTASPVAIPLAVLGAAP
ncbi:MAG: hypothetical protein HYS27_08130 [Deltaproteobacteria bacterium]|nr:hypothetical protein [Deltaproteobacteria bacterium]